MVESRKQYPNFKPEGHFIAYIDILGYRGLIKEARGAERIAETVYEYLQFMNNVEPFINEDEYPEYELKIKAFSDNIVICSKANWFEVLYATFLLQYFLFVRKKILVRGSLSYGEVHFNENFICGEGIVRAFDLESKIAIYPRVIIDDSYQERAEVILEDMQEIYDKLSLNSNATKLAEIIFSNILTDFDGCKFVDYLKFGEQYTLAKGSNEFKSNIEAVTIGKHRFEDELNQHGMAIWKKIEECDENKSEKMRVLQKILWCKNYHDRFCEKNDYEKLKVYEKAIVQ